MSGDRALLQTHRWGFFLIVTFPPWVKFLTEAARGNTHQHVPSGKLPADTLPVEAKPVWHKQAIELDEETVVTEEPT